MNCSQVLSQLPLHVESDLPEAEGRAVTAHLEACPACREALKRLAASQAWLKAGTEPPFDAQARAALRRAVMAQIRTSPRRRVLPWRPLLLAAASVALVVVTATRRGHPVPPPREAPRPPVTTVDVPGPAPTEALPQESPLRLARRAPSPEAPDEALTDLLPGGPSRIELQTDNPNVRIIWLARVAPDDQPSPQEQP